ncbi:hypothetical protein H6G69_13830 [Nostoc sp. FACHB-110]|nr:hypothetical protein [Nostoc sp. FACHB-110]
MSKKVKRSPSEHHHSTSEHETPSSQVERSLSSLDRKHFIIRLTNFAHTY